VEVRQIPRGAAWVNVITPLYSVAPLPAMKYQRSIFLSFFLSADPSWLYKNKDRQVLGHGKLKFA
jgi:hypothetical protein